MYLQICEREPPFSVRWARDHLRALLAGRTKPPFLDDFPKKKHVFFIFILVYPRVYYCFFLEYYLFILCSWRFIVLLGLLLFFLNVFSYFFNRFYGDISWDTDQQSDIWVCLTCGILYTLRK